MYETLFLSILDTGTSGTINEAIGATTWTQSTDIHRDPSKFFKGQKDELNKYMTDVIISTFFKSLRVVQLLQFLLGCNKLLTSYLGPGRGDNFRIFHLALPTKITLTTDQRGLYPLLSTSVKPQRVHRPNGHTVRQTWPELLLSPGPHFECLVAVCQFSPCQTALENLVIHFAPCAHP